MNADIYEMYHGTAADFVESIIRTGLRPSEVGPTLSSDLSTAWHIARSRSEAAPVVLAYAIPDGCFDEYFETPIPLAQGVIFYALKHNLPASWMTEQILKSDPRVAIFG